MANPELTQHCLHGHIFLTGRAEMDMDERVVSASELKATCPTLLNQLAAGKITRLVITKRGRRVAVVTPAETEAPGALLFGCMAGSVVAPGGFDFTAPVLDEWLSAATGHGPTQSPQGDPADRC